MSSGNTILKAQNIQHHLPPKLAIASLIDSNCLSECLINKASVSTTNNKYYYGTCENTFKELYNSHKCSFRNKSREKNAGLSNYICGN